MDKLIGDAQVTGFFSHGKGAIPVEAYELLRQNRSLARRLPAPTCAEARYNGISGYVMAPFVYRLNRIGGKRAGSRMAVKDRAEQGGKMRRR